jgi:pimeloyl-ACP methyl ester carboxylesterase
VTALDRVVLVHGLWMTGLEFGVLRRRLSDEHGFDVEVFTYPTTGGDAAAIVSALRKQLQPRAGERVHLVGHSLGGAFVYRALCDDGACGTGVGNAVLLGSPLAGCRAAQGAARHASLHPLLGTHVLRELMAAPPRAWRGPAALGAIAGSRPLGLGRFLAHFEEDNDGTVGVGETRIPGLADHLVLPHSHLGMLFAADVAAQVARFLREGHFDHGV